MSSLIDKFKSILLYKEIKEDEGFILDETPTKKNGTDSSKSVDNEDIKVSNDIDANLKCIESIFSYPDNSDFIIRRFVIGNDKKVKTAVIFFDGYIDKNMLDRDILQPMMIMSQFKEIDCVDTTVNCVMRQLLPQLQPKLHDSISNIVDEINSGSCAIFLDGSSRAIVCDVKGWEHRTVERPNTEMLIRGPQQGFTEVIRINTALIRSIVRDENLIAENINIGKKIKTPCAMMYIKGVANDSLVNEVRRRITSLNIDHIVDSGELEQLIEDSTYLPAPQVLATERPDRASALIMQGRVAMVLQGSPFVLIVPVTMLALLHSGEDAYLRFPYSNFVRIIRLTGVFLSLVLPALYVAITVYHHEMLPTELLFAIQNSREKVPFPTIVEILIMEFSFELIREAGVRIPTPIGPTLGIVGALILGQAAVAANIVSPVLIIIVAITGIGSFAIPNFSFSFAMRMMRFAYIIITGIAGFLGMTALSMILLLWFASAKSFGVRFLSPLAPKTSDSIFGALGRQPVWKQEMRPDYLSTSRRKQQDHISRGWLNKKKNN